MLPFVHPSSVVTQGPWPDPLILELWGLLEPENAFSYTIKIYGTKPKVGAKIFALGYNSGATGSTTRELKKGYGQKETLESILPHKDKKAIENFKMPDVNLDIYYLDGSLLPGFSGSPVVNESGKLIGIGDGGLEKGASNVSWVIPAKYLDDLTMSTTTTLPSGLNKAGQLFSAEVNAPDTYEEINYEGYTFVKTKTRTLKQMKETSDDPEGLTRCLKFFERYEDHFDLDKFQFDIYEDINHGVIIVLPQGTKLTVIDIGGTSQLSSEVNFASGNTEYSIFQYCGHILGCLLINDTVIAKGFVLWTGFVQTLPIG